MLRQTIAIVVGFVAWTLLWLFTNAALQAAMPEAVHDGNTFVSSLPLLLALLGASVICSLVAGLSVGAISRQRQLRPALGLGILLLLVGIAVQVSVWSQLPTWYHLAFLALLMPVTLAGTLLTTRPNRAEVTG